MTNRIFSAFAFAVTLLILATLGCNRPSAPLVVVPPPPARATIVAGPISDIEIVPAPPAAWNLRSLTRGAPEPVAADTPAPAAAPALSETLAARPLPSQVRRDRSKEARVGDRELSSASVAKAIKQQIPRVRACYERALKKESDLEGRLTVAWSVEPAGTVTDVQIVQDRVGSEWLNNCVTKAVRRWSFPASANGASVEYPVVLRGGGLPSNG